MATRSIEDGRGEAPRHAGASPPPSRRLRSGACAAGSRSSSKRSRRHGGRRGATGPRSRSGRGCWSTRWSTPPRVCVGSSRSRPCTPGRPTSSPAPAQTPRWRPAVAGRDADDPALLEQLLSVPQVHLIVDGYNVTKSGYGELPLEDPADPPGDRARIAGGANPGRDHLCVRRCRARRSGADRLGTPRTGAVQRRRRHRRRLDPRARARPSPRVARVVVVTQRRRDLARCPALGGVDGGIPIAARDARVALSRPFAAFARVTSRSRAAPTEIGVTTASPRPGTDGTLCTIAPRSR